MTSRIGNWRTITWMALGLVVVGCNSTSTQPENEEPPVTATPGYTLAFRNSNSHTVVPGEVLTLDLLINREEGFEGLIELTASSSPGIVVIMRPATVLHRDDSDLLVVADQSTQRRLHQIEFTGRSEGRPPQTTTLSLTVVDSK